MQCRFLASKPSATTAASFVAFRKRREAAASGDEQRFKTAIVSKLSVSNDELPDSQFVQFFRECDCSTKSSVLDAVLLDRRLHSRINILIQHYSADAHLVDAAEWLKIFLLLHNKQSDAMPLLLRHLTVAPLPSFPASYRRMQRDIGEALLDEFKRCAAAADAPHAIEFALMLSALLGNDERVHRHVLTPMVLFASERVAAQRESDERGDLFALLELAAELRLTKAIGALLDAYERWPPTKLRIDSFKRAFAKLAMVGASVHKPPTLAQRLFDTLDDQLHGTTHFHALYALLRGYAAAKDLPRVRQVYMDGQYALSVGHGRKLALPFCVNYIVAEGELGRNEPKALFQAELDLYQTIKESQDIVEPQQIEEAFVVLMEAYTKQSYHQSAMKVWKFITSNAIVAQTERLRRANRRAYQLYKQSQAAKFAATDDFSQKTADTESTPNT